MPRPRRGSIRGDETPRPRRGYFSGAPQVQSAATNYPLRGGKASDWEGGHRVAAFVGGGALPGAVRGTALAGVPTHVADWFATFSVLAGASPDDPGATAAGLPPVDGEDLWPYLTNGTSVPRRRYLPLSSLALLEVRTGLKLMFGTQAFAGTVGPTFPNASSPARDPQPVSRDCGSPPAAAAATSGGCLYDVANDDIESADLAASRPGDLARLAAAFDDVQKTFYDNDENGTDAAICADAPAGVPCACHVAVEKYDGFLGPFQDVDF